MSEGEGRMKTHEDQFVTVSHFTNSKTFSFQMENRKEKCSIIHLMDTSKLGGLMSDCTWLEMDFGTQDLTAEEAVRCEEVVQYRK